MHYSNSLPDFIHQAILFFAGGITYDEIVFVQNLYPKMIIVCDFVGGGEDVVDKLLTSSVMT